MDSFIVLFTRWRIADEAALAACERLCGREALASPSQRRVQAFIAQQFRAVADGCYRELVAALAEARSRVPLI